MTTLTESQNAIVESTMKMIGKMERNLDIDAGRRDQMSLLIADTLRTHVLSEYQALVLSEYSLKGGDKYTGNKVLFISDITNIIEAFEQSGEYFIDNIVKYSVQCRKDLERIEQSDHTSIESHVEDAKALYAMVNAILNQLLNKMDSCSL